MSSYENRHIIAMAIALKTNLCLSLHLINMVYE